MGYTGALVLFRVRLDFDVSGCDLLLGCLSFGDLGIWTSILYIPRFGFSSLGIDILDDLS